MDRQTDCLSRTLALARSRAHTHAHQVSYVKSLCHIQWTRQRTAIHYNTLQHTVTHCNTLQHTATRYITLQRTATHCNTLQHTATQCIKRPIGTLQHTATRQKKQPKWLTLTIHVTKRPSVERHTCACVMSCIYGRVTWRIWMCHVTQGGLGRWGS